MMIARLRAWLALPMRFHAYGSLGILFLCAHVISLQIMDRAGFASGELARDVMERWGAPVQQAAPSVRYVESGSVFNTLHPLALERQRVSLDADMSYRKRGLVYFSGFDFRFRGEYAIANPEPHSIDAVFVFPVQVADQAMLSDLRFTVNEQAESLPFDRTARRLTWTGRVAPGEQVRFAISFAGRGLDSFAYQLDPELPVRDFALDIAIRGGENFDYPQGAYPATAVQTGDDGTRLHWEFPSVKAGFATGVILPSERSFDQILQRMIRRAWAPFLLLLAALWALAIHRERPLTMTETYFGSAVQAFFYVLAAYVHFYAAFAVALALCGGLLVHFFARLLGHDLLWPLVGAVAALLGFPNLAVVLEPHTGILYTLEILAGLIVVSLLFPRPEFRRVLASLNLEEPTHAS
jgi:hypothetical protein